MVIWIYVISKMLTANSNVKMILWIYETHLAGMLPVWGGSIFEEGKGEGTKEVLVY